DQSEQPLAIDLSAEGVRSYQVEFTNNSPFTTAPTPITNFAQVGLDSDAVEKTVYLRATGTYGQVTYKGFKVEGSPDIVVARAGTVYNRHHASSCGGGNYNTPTLNAPFNYKDYPGGGSREESFDLV